jgi:hypothetical protein
MQTGELAYLTRRIDQTTMAGSKHEGIAGLAGIITELISKLQFVSSLSGFLCIRTPLDIMALYRRPLLFSPDQSVRYAPQNFSLWRNDEGVISLTPYL